ncbi:MAG: MBL fold metallo-hydrolase [Gammaproteobacteria bacterium]|nr:MBL fold metallo-hydrolase [Gammaproteobacteria bacterium]
MRPQYKQNCRAEIRPTQRRAEAYPIRWHRTWNGYLVGCILFIAIGELHAAILPAPQQVSPHCWAWIGPYGPASKANQGYRMNLGFVVGSQAVAVIDSGYTPAMAKAMLSHIRRITPKPVRYVINTNSQPHRFFGNEVFRKAGAKIIATREAAERMHNEEAQFAASIATTLGIPPAELHAPAAPDQLLEFDHPITIALGDSTLTITPVGRSHTRGSLVVQVQPDRVVFAGDVLMAGRLLAVIPDGSIKEWIAAYQRLRTLDADIFIPGHGPPGKLSSFDHPTLSYLTLLKSHMDKAVQQGMEINRAIDQWNDAAWQGLENYTALANRNAYQAYLESQEDGF